ncbi:hypothetical protein GH733_004468 [Mirounga leonina]|nr:hypothetical protein GH733_004468 [Mirounga leonina]
MAILAVEKHLASATAMLHQILDQAKKHPSLICIFLSALYVLCLALFNPDVIWARKNNIEPWNKLGPNDQYKFCSVTGTWLLPRSPLQDPSPGGGAMVGATTQRHPACTRLGLELDSWGMLSGISD